jgi:hypothetical protein
MIRVVKPFQSRRLKIAVLRRRQPERQHEQGDDST